MVDVDAEDGDIKPEINDRRFGSKSSVTSKVPRGAWRPRSHRFCKLQQVHAECVTHDTPRRSSTLFVHRCNGANQ